MPSQFDSVTNQHPDNLDLESRTLFDAMSFLEPWADPTGDTATLYDQQPEAQPQYQQPVDERSAQQQFYDMIMTEVQAVAAKQREAYEERIRDLELELARRTDPLDPQIIGQAIAQAIQANPSASVTTSSTRAQTVRFGSDVPAFDGKAQHLESFLFNVSTRMDAQKASLPADSDRVNFFATFLGNGPGFQWFMSLRQTKDATLLNFDRFVEAFKRHFADPNLKDRMREALDSHKQSGPVAKYAARFRKIASYLDLFTESKTDKFLRGLKPEIRALYRTKDLPATLNGIIEECIAYDGRIRRIDNLDQHDAKPITRASAPSSSSSSPIFEYPQTHTSTSTSTSTSTFDTVSLPTDTPMQIDAARIQAMLTEHGKLTPEEKQRRKDQGLCFYCGLGPHITENCPIAPEPVRARSKALRIVRAGTQPVSETSPSP